MFIVTESIRIKPLTNAVIPAILFQFTVETNDFELITSIDGVLLSEDEKVISSLIESYPHISKAQEYSRGKLCAKNTQQDEDLNRMTDFRIEMMAILNEKAIDHIEQIRNYSNKKDVVLRMRIRAKKLVSNTLISRLDIKKQSGDSFLTHHRQLEVADPKLKDLWILSADSSPIFLNTTELIEEFEVTIKASDWIHDYAPQFGIGKFLVVEMPIITPDFQPGNEFEKRIDEAIKTLPKLEEKIKEGEWNEVIEKARPVLELIRSKDELKPILMKSGYNEEATDNFLAGIDAFFNYSSKFIHRVSRPPSGQLMREISSEKEDAYLIYSLATSLVNLLSRKISKIK